HRQVLHGAQGRTAKAGKDPGYGVLRQTESLSRCLEMCSTAFPCWTPADPSVPRVEIVPPLCSAVTDSCALPSFSSGSADPVEQGWRHGERSGCPSLRGPNGTPRPLLAPQRAQSTDYRVFGGKKASRSVQSPDFARH